MEAARNIASVAEPRVISDAKRHGVHYTPTLLAEFLARQALAASEGRSLSALDPACGDGELLAAIAAAAEAAGLPAPRLTGIDRDPAAIAVATQRLRGIHAASVQLRCGDFLEVALSAGQLRAAEDEPPASYDIVISNPPYVRTQVLGGERAQQLGRAFGLTGRVDLYHAFVCAMSSVLKEDGGVLALLCSNRFLSTRGGASLRRFLLREFELRAIWDLGDTRLFSAAVLPAIVIGRRGHGDAAGQFVRIYEEPTPDGEAVQVENVVAALQDGLEGFVQTETGCFHIDRGTLDASDSARGWRLTSEDHEAWLATVKRNTAKRLGELGSIRVGIKTTADKVFIRPTWNDLPEEQQPEEALLHPLITHRIAERWSAGSAEGDEARIVLYPHESAEGRRRPVDLDHFPRARAYLEAHRAQLEDRDYVRKAGRQWYEIWVPQQPAAWAAQKIVWPDISDRPRFFLDQSGAIVNGDCYWINVEGLSEAEIALVLAVANSSFAVSFYDRTFGNKLYAGRRRFITQYVERLPLPAVDAETVAEITRLVGLLCAGEGERDELAARLDELVWDAFGLVEEVCR